jgi:carotenoid 1,2-hydratase
VWHPTENAPGGYEWWYFDAISDDGRDALVIIFLADFVFSPLFNRAVGEHRQKLGREPRPAEFPAVSLCLYRDGRLRLRANNEYTTADFSASRDEPFCRIGRSDFRFIETPQGRSYEVTIDEHLRGGRRFSASLSWAVSDGDFSSRGASGVPADANARISPSGHEWNIVAPRCHVEGIISLVERDGARIDERRFGGTGYHDHNRDGRWMPATIAEWQWGRAHFADKTTAVFYRYRENADEMPTTRLFTVRDGELVDYAAQLKTQSVRRHHFGICYPQSLEFMAKAESRTISLIISQRRVLEGSYFYLRFLSEATLDIGDGSTQSAQAITEHLAPRALCWRWLDWLTNMRIGRNGRGSFLK